MSEALWRQWKETSISVILRPTLIDDSSFIFCQFFEKPSSLKGQVPWRENPSRICLEYWRYQVYQERFGRGRYDDTNFSLCSLIHSSSSLIPAGCARLVAARANSSDSLKLNLCAEILFIGGFLMQKWGKNTHWNLHSSPNPVPYIDLLFPCTTQKMFPISRVVLHTKCCWFLSD